MKREYSAIAVLLIALITYFLGITEIFYLTVIFFLYSGYHLFKKKKFVLVKLKKFFLFTALPYTFFFAFIHFIRLGGSFTLEYILVIGKFALVMIGTITLATFSGLIVRLFIPDNYNRDITYSIIILLISVLPAASLGWAWQIPVVGVSYFIAGLLLNKQKRFAKGLLIYYLPVFVLIIIPTVIDSLYHLYPFSATALFSFSIGSILKNKSRFRIATTMAFLLLMLLSYPAMLNYLAYVQNLKYEKNIHKTGTDALHFYTNDNEKLLINDLSGKITFLYFWTTSCGVCYNKFPQIEEMFHEYPLDKVNIYAVNCLYKQETIEIVSERMKKFGYHLPFIFVKAEQQSLLSGMGINSFPHIVILDKDGSILYNGIYNNNPLVYVNNASRIINKALNVKLKNEGPGIFL